MALHGSIKVNECLIGYWVATRVGGSDSPDDVNTYRCEVVRVGALPVRGYTVEFEVKHRYGDGAFELLRKIMAAKKVTRLL